MLIFYEELSMPKCR